MTPTITHSGWQNLFLAGRRWLGIFIFISACLLSKFPIGINSSVAFAAESQTVLDAKRDAVKKMFKDGKYPDALSLLNEIISSDGSTAKDYLMLAHIEEKLGHLSDCKAAYRKFLELSTNPKDLEERSGRSEAEKKLKSMDAMTPKIDSALEAFSAKLDQLEREAVSSRDPDAYDRIFRLRGNLIRAEKPANAAYCEVNATNMVYTTSEMKVNKGDKLHIYARGTWKYKKTAEYTPAGIKGDIYNGYPRWSLVCYIEGQQLLVGEEHVIVVEKPGILYFSQNADVAARAEASGSVMVLIRKE
jgi:tetratricopeptide (TPR) repeat protein